MADAAAKHFSIHGGTLITDLKSLSSLLKTRRTVAFAYGFMFAFVAFTVFLAFSPSSNSSSPWFTNIFTTSTRASTAATDSYRSQFSSIFSHVFPSNTSAQPSHDYPSLPAQNTTTRSNNTASESLITNKELPSVKNHTQSIPSVKNHTQKTEDSFKSTVLQSNKSTVAPIVNKEPPLADTRAQSTEKSNQAQALKPNQTAVEAPKAAVAVNQSVNPPSKAGSLGKDNSAKVETESAEKRVKANYTSSLLKNQTKETKQSNEVSSGVSAKKGVESLVQNLVNCEFFDGEWVMDDSYPLYKPGSCSLIDEQFDCILNGRPDKDYQKYKWKPKRCTLPRLNAGHMLNMLRGKRLVFVGDSLNRNMWESLVCILKGAVKDQRKVFEANGRHYFRGEASYSFIFKDYNFTVEFFVSPFLVREWEMLDKNGSKKETLRLDLVGKSSDQYKNADVLIFNTGHWWTHEKTSLGKDYYQEGSHVYGELNVLEAFRKAITTWGRWIDANINPTKTLVFFRGYSASHFSGGQWNSGGACDSEAEPIKNVAYLREYPPKMAVLERVLRGMKTHVSYLNITQMTDYRKDGHPSMYRKRSHSEADRISPMHFQDCSHWCLPGVPDTWNEIIYAELLINDYQKRQVQKRHR